jgi:ATP-dependent Zn protease
MRTYQPGPHGQAPAVTWRQWLLPLGAAAGIAALATMSRGAPQGVPLSYSRFLTDIGAGSVRALTINPAGQVTGSLTTGQPFTTTVAIHEAGHALVATVSQYADPVSRVTILGAGRALGLTEQLPADDRRLYGERYLADALAVRLGGRAAELLVRGEASTGAADDLASATAMATQMVREFGLSQSIGPVSYAGAQTWSFASPGTPRGYSERTQWRVDREVATLLTRAEARARELLTEHMQALHQLTTALVERETITGDQVRALVRAASPPSASADRPDLR